MSVIVPASNEAGLIGGCLRAIGSSKWLRDAPVEIIVIANGCHDNTAERAKAEESVFAARGWRLIVLERETGGKLGALNAGDAVVSGRIRVYLDADVTVGPDLLAGLCDALDRPEPRYASGRVRITARGWISRGYARIWRKVPFMAQTVPGCGVFAVNEAGRGRWGAFPDIISDDIFVRLSFSPDERVGVPAPYDWPIAEGFANLIKVRRRQDAGVAEIEARYPERAGNDDKPAFPASRKLAMALRDPLGFAIYSGVALAVKLTRQDARQDWSRGR